MNSITPGRNTLILYAYRRYLQCWFLFDVISCMPIAYIMLSQKFEDRRYIFLAHVLPLFRAPRLGTVVVDIKVFMKVGIETFFFI